MIWRQREPTLKEILSDPIVTALMSADGVDPLELEAMLTHIISRKSKSPRQTGRWGTWPCRPAPTYKAQQRPEPPSRTDVLQAPRRYTVLTL
jgi:hypothetical protein